MKLRFDENLISQIGARYRYTVTDNELVALKPTILAKGYLDKSELRKVVHWKAARVVRQMESNSDNYVREVTRFALSTPEERARIESLTLLDGVLWPTASVILHFFHQDAYPILDFRTLWSVGLQVPPQYTFIFWWEYVQFCRELSKRMAVDMRTLDKALWQYSKENQPKT